MSLMREAYLARLAEFDQPIPRASATPSDASKSAYVSPGGSSDANNEHAKAYNDMIKAGHTHEVAQRHADSQLNSSRPIKSKFATGGTSA